MKAHVLTLVVLTGCSAANPGTPGSTAVGHPDVPGTVFTIVFENHNADEVLTPGSFFSDFAQRNAEAAAYVVGTHPSLPNYILLTSGSANGVSSDNSPAGNVEIEGTDNLADQLDRAGIAWRAYMESMGSPCAMNDVGEYAVHHDPFVYYQTMQSDPARCANRVVDFDAHFATDLASGAYRYMWITPNDCNDMHSCAVSVANTWLERVVTQIQAASAYKNGGAIFVVGDEGSTRFLGASANVIALWASPKLARAPFVSNTSFNHRSYVATIEDIFSIPRLPATVEATPMDEFFVARATK
jgi:phosphatidylinositol-3-phosphatase